jgi:CDP-glycerol glycerophosphotransferase (TagB/SpsB family)
VARKYVFQVGSSDFDSLTGKRDNLNRAISAVTHTSSKDPVPILTRVRRTPFFSKSRFGRAQIYHWFARVFMPLRKNRVLVLSDSRRELSGNLEFIVRELQTKHPEFDVVMMLRPSLRAGRTQRDTFRLPFLIATSRFIVLDDYYPYINRLKLRKGVELIQAWHAAGAFKRVGFSRMGLPGGPSEDSISHRGYTDAVVSSESIRPNYAEAFRMPIEGVHAVGVPRSDVFFDADYVASVRTRIREQYGVRPGQKVVLYAPTFRGNGQRSAKFDASIVDWQKLAAGLGEDAVVMVKMHPFVRRYPVDAVDLPTFINVSKEREINDLLFAADVLVTDYSSVIFEFALLKRPIVFHVPDLDDYRESRDFYYPFETYLCGPTTTTTDELIAAIKEETLDTAALDAFVEFYMSACDGHSTERFVQTLIVDRAAPHLRKLPASPSV